MMNKWKKGMIAGVTVAAAATYTTYGMTAGQTLRADATEHSVEIISAYYGDLSSTVMVPGSLELVNRQIIYPNLESTAYEILVEAGQDVEVGTPLIQYDTMEMNYEIEDIELQMERTQTAIQQLTTRENEVAARKNSADVRPTYMTLEETGEKMEVEPLVTIAELDLELSELADLKKEENYSLTRLTNQLENLNEQKRALTVESEIDGKVLTVDKQGQPTDSLGNERPLVEVADTSMFTITGNVSEKQSLDVELGQMVTLYSDSIEEGFWMGEVIDVSYFPTEGDDWYGESASSQYPVTILLTEGETERLRPGYQMMAEIVTEDRMGLTIEMDTVQYDEFSSYVLVYENGMAAKREVEIGYADEYSVEILSGLTEEDQVIYDYTGQITEGMTVTPVDYSYEEDIYEEDDGLEQFEMDELEEENQ